MNFNELAKHISGLMPPFNNDALKEFVKRDINNSPEFPAMILREGFKIVPADIEFLDYRILSPEERVKFELASNSNKTSSRPKVPLTVSHLRLAEYRTRFEHEIVRTFLYSPYLYDGMMYIKDKRSMIRKVILEKTFSRVNDKDKDGLTISPTRANLTFNRRHTYRATSYVTGEFYSHWLVIAKLFHGSFNTKSGNTTIVHYMLAKFGFLGTLKRFGISKNDISFVEMVGDDTQKYEYFAGKAFDDPVAGPGLFLRVKKTIFNDDQSFKFVVNLLYAVSFFNIQNIENVYVDKGSVWKVILGIILFNDRAEPKAYSNAESHIKTVDHFIDPLTKRRFNTFGVIVDDIYDVLVYIFIHIDSFMVNNLVQDIFNSRLDVLNGILVESYSRKITLDIYALGKRTNIKLKDVKSALSFNPMLFNMPAGGKKDDGEHYKAPPEIVGDNYLFSGGLNKIRLGGRAEHRLHPSFCAAESIGAFVGKYIGKTGYLNPYIPTDKNLAIVRPAYIGEIEAIIPYLPK